MQVLLDFLPVVLFFIAYKWAGIYIATAAMILTSFLQVLYTRYKTGVFQKMPLVTLGIVMLLGGATLLLKNQIFIQWKPTIVYGVLALVLGINHAHHNLKNTKLLLQLLFEKQLSLDVTIWQKLNISWILFFITLGTVNIYVVYHYDTNTWVHFKLFGTLGATLVFVLLQGLYLSKHIRETSS